MDQSASHAKKRHVSNAMLMRKKVPVEGQCCGVCVKKLCTHTDKNGNEVTSEIGESWNPSECEVCNCEKAADGSAKTSCKPSGKTPWNPNGDLCEKCKCVHKDGQNIKECEKTTCPTCEADEKEVAIAGQCCGKCVKKVCTHKNAKGEETTSEIGETWDKSECEVCSCE